MNVSGTNLDVIFISIILIKVTESCIFLWKSIYLENLSLAIEWLNMLTKKLPEPPF